MANLIEGNPLDKEYYEVYTAYFNFGGQELSVSLFDYKTFKDGFWLDEEFNYSNGRTEMIYWIPPHCVNYVRKEIREIVHGT